MCLKHTHLQHSPGYLESSYGQEDGPGGRKTFAGSGWCKNTEVTRPLGHRQPLENKRKRRGHKGANLSSPPKTRGRKGTPTGAPTNLKNNACPAGSIINPGHGQCLQQFTAFPCSLRFVHLSSAAWCVFFVQNGPNLLRKCYPNRSKNSNLNTTNISKIQNQIPQSF